MNELTRRLFLEALSSAYELGAYALKKVNSKGGFTKTAYETERKAFSRILKQFGEKPLTEEEQDEFFNS